MTDSTADTGWGLTAYVKRYFTTGNTCGRGAVSFQYTKQRGEIRVISLLMTSSHFIFQQVIFLLLQYFPLGKTDLELDLLGLSLVSSMFKMLGSLCGQHPLGAAIRLNTFRASL